MTAACGRKGPIKGQISDKEVREDGDVVFRYSYGRREAVHPY